MNVKLPSAPLFEVRVVVTGEVTKVKSRLGTGYPFGPNSFP